MTPAIRVDLDGIDITANLIPAPFGLPLDSGGAVIPGGSLSGGPLISIAVTDYEAKTSDSVELVIDNREQYPAPAKGSQFQVWMGYAETGLTNMGTFQVDSWKKKGRPRTLIVSAKAVGFTTEIKSPKSRSYHQMTVGGIVNQVAGYSGLSAIVHPSLSAISIGHLDQSNESDLHFMTRLGERVGGNFKLANGGMIMNLAGSGTLPSGSPAPVFSISETDATVKEWEASGNERGSYGSAQAFWQDTKQGQRQTVSVGSGNPVYRIRSLFKTQVEAQQSAQARLSALNRGKISLDLSLWGNPDIFAGARVQAGDFDPDVDGLFGIKMAKHKIDGSGFDTNLNCESAKEDGGDDANLVGGTDDGDGGAGLGGADAGDAADDAEAGAED